MRLLPAYVISVLATATTAFSAPILEWKPTQPNISGQKLTPNGTLAEAPEFNSHGQLLFQNKQHILLPNKLAKKLPADALTLEASVRIDTVQKWGSIVSFSEDNGSYERGWLLGYNGNRFSFRLSTGGSLLNAQAPEPYKTGQWYHLLGVFDGKKMQLYVDGTLVATTPAVGKIALPDPAMNTPFVIGAYKDKDEFYPHHGAISSVRIHPKVLTAPDIAKLAKSSGLFSFAVRPAARFLAPGKALLTWEATTPGKATIAYGPTPKLGTTITSDSKTTQHQITLEGLLPNTLYHYRIASHTQNGPRFSKTYELDTAMNYMPDILPPAEKENPLASSHLQHLPDQPGLAVVIGLSDGSLTTALARQSQLTITAFDDDPQLINQLRRSLYKSGLYGKRITLHHTPDLKKIPLTSCTGNLVCTERKNNPSTNTELHRLTRPGGGVTIIPGEKPSVRDPLPGAGEWTHQYGPPSNTAFTGERLAGAKETGELELQWIGRPGADFGIDRQPRMSAPLATNGRLFHQGLNRLIALDAYNGQILWGMEVPDLRRVNIPHDCANWCADPDHLYLAVKDLLWVIDAATGKLVSTLTLTASQRDTHDWGFIAQEGKMIIGSSVRRGAEFKNYWGDAWYDKVGRDSDTANVVSDNLFGYTKGEWKGKWAYENKNKGLIINPTISLSDGKICFLETRNPDLKKNTTGREFGAPLWKNVHAVCLNATTGKIIWQKPFPKTLLMTPEKGYIQVSYGAMTSQGFLTVLSEGIGGNGIFSYHYFDLENGDLKFQSQTPWRTNHHGAHISHPVVYEDKVYIDPTGISLPDGKILDHKFGPREGCSAAVGTSYGLFFRGISRCLTVWSHDQKKPTAWPRLRPSCWLSFLPAQGLFLVPEGGGGCSCGSWMETSLAFIPGTIAETETTTETNSTPTPVDAQK